MRFSHNLIISKKIFIYIMDREIGIFEIQGKQL